MEKEFIPYEQALELAKLNFNWNCFGYYDTENELHIEISCNLDSNLVRRNFIAVPTYQQAFRWFRENYNLLYNINETYEKSSKYIYSIGYGWSDALESYEEAELECLKKLIEIVKEK